MGCFKNKIKEENYNKQGLKMTIVKYISAFDIDVVFENKWIAKNRCYDDFKKGKIKNPYFPYIYGVGYVGVGNYETSINSIPTKNYSAWSNMLERCYSKKFQEKQPTYLGCSVIPEWCNFQIFAEWYENNYKDGFMLDKDILQKGNKTYRGNACCFVPQEINNLFIKSNKLRGCLPIGVRQSGNKYTAQLSKNGIKLYLGIFDTPEEAFQSYKIAKEEYIKEAADVWKSLITEQVYQALINYKVEITD